MLFGCAPDVRGSRSDCIADPSLSPFDLSCCFVETNTLSLRLSLFTSCLGTCYFLQPCCSDTLEKKMKEKKKLAGVVLIVARQSKGWRVAGDMGEKEGV